MAIYRTPPDQQPPAPPATIPEGNQPQNGMGVAGMVLGILCLFVPFMWFILAPLAIVFGAIGRSRVSQGTADNRVQANCGIVLGSAGVIVWTVMALLIV